MEYFQKANDVYNTKDYSRAISLYKKAAEMKDNEAGAIYNSAVCFIHLKKYEDAIPLFHAAISLRPESKYFFNLAYCYAMCFNKPKALYYFNTAWSLNNDDEDCEKAINLLLKSYKKAT
ncbi:tetratricopeptide repeat protein [Clostridium sp.]|uniref:tetratricopeptide repeat protein n=1 Tax=Clostridium sp. TaxID=1506 RepID=UPI00262D88C2|nr:tetratricopeptide repeat protein [uncultured Clostridium sp.]